MTATGSTLISPPPHAPVVLLHYAGPHVVGGVESTIGAHARQLAALGYPVQVVVGEGDELGAGVTRVIVPELSSRGSLVEQINRELAVGLVSDAFESLVARIADRLSDLLSRAGSVIVHNVLTLHKNLAFTAALHRLYTAGRIPHLLAWCHDFAWLDPLYQPELHPGLPWNLLREPWPGVQYVVVSEDRQRMLAGLLALACEQILVISPGVDLELLLKLEPQTIKLITALDLFTAAPLLLLPARISRRKNIEQAITILGALRDLNHDAKLVVTGPPGPHNPTNTRYLADLLNLRRAVGVEREAVFLYETLIDVEGRPRAASDALIADLFHLADALLFPSSYEGFGIPVLEAGLSGIPIFCSDIPPLRATAGAAATYFHKDEPPNVIADRISTALLTDQRYLLRRRVRTEYTWEGIVRRSILPLLK